MIVRKFYDIRNLSKGRLIELLGKANEIKDRVEYRKDLTGFKGTTEESIEMIRKARHNGFYCFREIFVDATEYEVGCRFSTDGKDDHVLNIRMTEDAGRALIKQFDLEEWQP